jgi:hypothetical protein
MKIFFIFLIPFIVCASDIVKLPKSNSLNEYEKLYGKAQKVDKDHLKIKNKDFEIYLDLKNNKIIKTEFRFYKSNKTLSQYKNKLEDYQYLKNRGHLGGRELYFVKDNQTIIFNNNSKKNLKAVIIRW